MNLKNLLSCIHRHSIEEHPACFIQNQIIDKRQDKSVPWYLLPNMQIGYLDIETDNLKADFGTMLSWAIRFKGSDTTKVDYITKKELFDGSTDKRIIESLIDTLKQVKIVVTYYGTGFDIPFSRAKALHYDLEFPSYADLYHFDIYYSVKSKLGISSKSLASACDYLNITGKTPLDKETWRRAKYGDPTAIQIVLEHNVADVDILEQLHNKLSPFSKWTKRSI